MKLTLDAPEWNLVILKGALWAVLGDRGVRLGTDSISSPIKLPTAVFKAARRAKVKPIKSIHLKLLDFCIGYSYGGHSAYRDMCLKLRNVPEDFRSLDATKYYRGMSVTQAVVPMFSKNGKIVLAERYASYTSAKDTAEHLAENAVTSELADLSIEYRHIGTLRFVFLAKAIDPSSVIINVSKTILTYLTPDEHFDVLGFDSENEILVRPVRNRTEIAVTDVKAWYMGDIRTSSFQRIQSHYTALLQQS